MSDESLDLDITKGDEGGIADASEGDNGGSAGASDPGSIVDSPDSEKSGGESPDKEAQVPKEEYSLSCDEKEFPIHEDDLKSLTAMCRKNGLTKAQAEAVLQWNKDQYSIYQKTSQQGMEATKAAWKNDLLNDRDFGGSNIKGTIADARKALRVFDSNGALRKLLVQTGGAEHPDVIRALARVGRSMGEHDYVGGDGGGRKARQAPLWERMYGKSGTEQIDKAF